MSEQIDEQEKIKRIVTEVMAKVDDQAKVGEWITKREALEIANSMMTNTDQDHESLERLVETEQLKTSLLEAARDSIISPYLFYDGINDVLTFKIPEHCPITVVHYIDKYLAFLYEPDTMEIVGFHLEGFWKGFLLGRVLDKQKNS